MIVKQVEDWVASIGLHVSERDLPDGSEAWEVRRGEAWVTEVIASFSNKADLFMFLDAYTMGTTSA